MKRILFSAGEASSDLHASNLIKAINGLSTEQIDFTGLGGQKMIETGLFTPEYNNKDFAVSGLFELFGHLRKIYSALKYFKKMADLGSYDLAVLMDYPDFNIPLAKHLYKKGIPVIYYISPQVWVWRSNRAKKLARYSKEILCIFPFEKDFYSKLGLNVKYVGHPLIDEVNEYKKNSNPELIKKELGILDDEKVIAVLPGSRMAEIRYILPVLQEACSIIKNNYKGKHRFIVPIASTLKRKDIETVMNSNILELTNKGSYDVYSISDYVILASGTATVETALFELPMTIVYKVSALSAFLFKHFVRYKASIGMVNILLGQERFKEFFQERAKPELIAQDVLNNIQNPAQYKTLKNELKDFKTRIYDSDSPSIIVAKEVLKYL